MTSLPGEPVSLPAPSKRTAPSNLTQRILTGAIVLPFVLLAAYLGGWWFVGLVAIVASVGILEFCALGHLKNIQGSGLVGVPAGIALIVAFMLRRPELAPVLLALAAVTVVLLELIRGDHSLRRILVKTLVTLGAVLYVGLPSAFLVAIRQFPDGLTWLLMVLLLTWGTDTFAYIGGRLWGRHLLAPSISPKKTVEGALVGLVGGIIPAALLLAAAGRLVPALYPLLAVGPVIAIIGDLLESAFKRAFGIKDSHLSGLDIFPGHGGVLDRVDALILVATVTYPYLLAAGLAA